MPVPMLTANQEGVKLRTILRHPTSSLVVVGPVTVTVSVPVPVPVAVLVAVLLSSVPCTRTTCEWDGWLVAMLCQSTTILVTSGDCPPVGVSQVSRGWLASGCKMKWCLC